MKTKSKSNDELGALNETGTRQKTDRREDEQPIATERRKVQRRRLIDPTTCERDYSNDEIEFMQAMDEYKRRSGRMFPTCSEILEVLRDLGYMRVEMPAEENDEEFVEAEEKKDEPESKTGVRTAAMIECDLDQLDDEYDDVDDEFDDEFDDD